MLARAPSFVKRSSPSEYISSRPTGYTLSGKAVIKSVTQGRPCSSDIVVTYPGGLCSIIYVCPELWAFGSIGFPFQQTLSVPGAILSPMEAVVPFTVTVPADISASAALRESTPQSVKYFWSLIFFFFFPLFEKVKDSFLQLYCRTCCVCIHGNAADFLSVPQKDSISHKGALFYRSIQKLFCFQYCGDRTAGLWKR